MGVYASVILVADVTFYSTLELMYMNFCAVLPVPFTIALSRYPANIDRYPEEDCYTPDTNMLNAHNQLMIWGSVFIPLGGIFGAYFYFYNTDEFMRNSDRKAPNEQGGFNS